MQILTLDHEELFIDAGLLGTIQLRENDRLIELPMIQAVLRSLGVAAVKGHHRSQLALADMVRTVRSGTTRTSSSTSR